jgi:hypothetical protein
VERFIACMTTYFHYLFLSFSRNIGNSFNCGFQKCYRS